MVVDPADYPWSSYRAKVGLAARNKNRDRFIFRNKNRDRFIFRNKNRDRFIFEQKPGQIYFPNGVVEKYGYNLENRLDEVRDGADVLIARYGYDPFGRRLWEEVGVFGRSSYIQRKGLSRK